MTDHAARLTDELLRRALTELAGSPDGDMVLTDVLRRVDQREQVARRPWDTRGWGRTAFVLIAALLLAAAAIGTTVLLWHPKPPPSAPISAFLSQDTQLIPFSYRIPGGEHAQLIPRVSGSEGGPVLSRVNGSRKLEVFTVTGYLHTCDVPGRTGNATLPVEPAGFLSGLRTELHVPLGETSTTTLGNLSAVRADIHASSSACGPALHLNNLGFSYKGWEPALKNPGRLILARDGDATIGVLISAATDADLAAWLPVAQDYVDTLVFEAPRHQP
jgi:hypothetical protein